jgi:phosphoribosylanthranilate isomerase
MWIKICANTNLADAQLAAQLGANAVGFVFAPSQRQVTATQVAAITSELPSTVEKIGVFCSSNREEIGQVVAFAGLTAAQLHGAFDAPLVRSLAATFGGGLKIIQTVSYEVHAADRAGADGRFEDALAQAFAEPALWAVLVDAARSGTSGGLGISFDWAHAAKILDRARNGLGSLECDAPKIILAGGLRAENVAAAIAALHPWGVDVASGVEGVPGRKDPERLRDFLAAAR